MPRSSIDLNVVTINDRKYYEYRVEFVVDQVAAYAANIRTMKVDVAYKKVGKTFALLGGKTFLSATDLNAQILGGKKIRSNFVKERDEEQKNSIIISRNVDIFSRSRKLSKFRLQSTKYIDLVSIVDSYDPVSNESSKQTTRLIASDLIKNNPSLGTSKGGPVVYSSLIQQGKDPAKYIVGSSLVEDATNSRRGIGKLNNPNASIANAFTTVAAQENNNNLLPRVLQVQKRQNVTTDITIPHTFRIPASTQILNGKFTIICTIRKSSGDLAQKVNFIVSQVKQIAEYSVPKKLPTTEMQFITRTHVQVNVFNDDPRISNIRLYSRDIPAYQTPMNHEPYRKISQITADWKEKLSSSRLPIKSGSSKIIRALPVLTTGIVLGNFESKTHTVREEVVAGTVVAISNKGNVEISLYESPANYKYVQFAKRSIDRKQKTWTEIQNPIKTIGGIASIEDFDVLNERTYEYAAFLQDSYGNVKKARTTSIIRVSDYTSGTELKITQKVLSVINGSTTTTFTIAVTLVKDSDTTALLMATKEQGIDTYFEQETLKLAGDLSSITKVNVKRLSLDTGTIVDLGVIAPGDYTDTTTENVVYIFEGLLRGQADLYEEIGADKIANKVFNPRDALQRSQIVSSALTKIPKNAKINFTQKFLSKKSLLRGTLSYGNTKAGDIDNSGFLQGRLGLTETRLVSKQRAITEIDNFNLIVADESRRMLSFDVKSSNSQKNIDFFIISTIKGSARSVIGTCHYVDDSISQYFLDDKTRLRAGRFSYVVTPVRYDGTALDEVSSQQFEVM